MFGERLSDATRSVPRGVEAVWRAEAVAATLRRVAVTLSFWTAVCLPVLLGALLLSGIQTQAEGGAFLGLTALEALALFGGRAYAEG